MSPRLHVVIWNAQGVAQQVIEFDNVSEANHAADQINETFEDSPLCCVITRLYGKYTP